MKTKIIHFLLACLPKRRELRLCRFPNSIPEPKITLALHTPRGGVVTVKTWPDGDLQRIRSWSIALAEAAGIRLTMWGL